MNREEALNLVSSPGLLRDLTGLNVMRYSDSDIYAEWRRLFPEMPGDGKLFIERLRYRPADFAIFRGDFDRILLLSPEELRELSFSLGASIMGFYVRELVNAGELCRFRKLLGESLFDYVYYFAGYAPYAEDLGIRGRLSVIRSDETEDAVLLSGCYALYRVLEEDGSPELLPLLRTKLSFAPEERVFGFFRIQRPLRPVKTSRVGSLIRHCLARSGFSL